MSDEQPAQQMCRDLLALPQSEPEPDHASPTRCRRVHMCSPELRPTPPLLLPHLGRAICVTEARTRDTRDNLKLVRCSQLRHNTCINILIIFVKTKDQIRLCKISVDNESVSVSSYTYKQVVRDQSYSA